MECAKSTSKRLKLDGSWDEKWTAERVKTGPFTMNLRVDVVPILILTETFLVANLVEKVRLI